MGLGRRGGDAAVGERQGQPFRLSFNGRLRVDFQGARVTSDGGLLLVRELDERLGFGELIQRHLTNDQGDCLAAKLRAGNVHSADGWEELLLPEIERQQAQGKEVAFRGDAAFARPEIYEANEARQVKYAIRLPANANLERKNHKVVDSPGGKAELQARGPLQELSLPGSELDQGAPGGGKGGVPLRRALPAGWLYRNQLPDFKPGGGTHLQPARNSGAVDHGRQAGGRDDAAFLPPLQSQRGTAVAEPCKGSRARASLNRDFKMGIPVYLKPVDEECDLRLADRTTRMLT